MINPIFILILAELGLILIFAYFFKKKMEITKHKKRTIAIYLVSFLLTSFTLYFAIGVYYLSKINF